MARRIRALVRMRLRLLTLLLAVLLAAISPRARADTRTDARRYFQQGMALIEQGKTLDGIAFLKKAYALHPHPSVLFNIARAYANSGAVDSAIEYFERYLDADPADAGRVQETLRELRQRKKLRAQVEAGMAAIGEGRYLEGIALLRRAYEVRPHPNILFNIARAYEELHDYHHAIQAFERYLKFAPQDAENVNQRLERLRALDRSRGAPPRAKPPAVARREEGRGRRARGDAEVRSGAGGGERGKVDPDEVERDRLADMLAEVKRKQDSAQPVLEPEPEPPAGDDDATRPPPSDAGGEGAHPEAGGPEDRPERLVVSATAAAGAGAELEAKGDNAFEEVVVTAARQEQSPLDAPNAVTIITDEDIRLSGARTIPDILRRVPGMDVMNMSYSDPEVAVRGFNRRIADKMLILIDGRTVYEDFLGGMLWASQTIDLLDIQRIEVVRGPGSAIYGAYAYTGIVNIITKRPDQVGGTIIKAQAGNGDAESATLQYGARHGPLGLRASFGYEHGDKYELEFDPRRVDYTSAFGDPRRSLENTRFDATADYRLKGSSARLFLGGGARSGFQELYGIAQLRNQGVEGGTYSVRAGYESDAFSLVGFWNGLRVVSAPEFYPTGLQSGGSHVHSDLFSVEPVFRPQLSFLGEHALIIGAEYRHKFIDWDYLDARHSEEHFAVFAQDTWTMSRVFSAIASARLDIHPLLGPLASPRVALIFKPAARQALRASVGTAFRQPTLAETYLNLSFYSPNVSGVAATLVGGRDRLSPENIETLDVGYLWEPEIGQFEVVTYLNRVTNLIILSPLAAAPASGMPLPSLGAYPGAVSNWVNDPSRYLAYGVELSARLYPVDGVDVGANYAFQYIYNVDANQRYTDSPLHKINVWGQFRTGIGLDLGLHLSWVSGQNWVEQTYDPTSSTGFNAHPLPLPGYFFLMGRIAKRLLEDRLELAVSGTNLADLGSNRHREHPFGNLLEARVLGSATVRF